MTTAWTAAVVLSFLDFFKEPFNFCAASAGHAGHGMQSFDAIVIGAGVIGCSVAYHLARFGAKRVLVLDRTQIGAGTTSQSSGILRTHYTVAENVELALASWGVFKNFAEYVGDPEASAGLVQCGYLIASPDGPKLGALREGLDGQRRQGITVR